MNFAQEAIRAAQAAQLVELAKAVEEAEAALKAAAEDRAKNLSFKIYLK